MRRHANDNSSGKGKYVVMLVIVTFFLVILPILFVACPADAEELEIIDLNQTWWESEANVALDLQIGATEDFKWFGSRASEDPTAHAVLAFDNMSEDDTSGFEFIYIRSAGIDDHADGALAEYDDMLIGRVQKWRDGAFKLWTGMEFFYGHAQYGNEDSLTFVAPLVSFTWTPNERWDTTTVLQYVGTHNTPWDGDRVFAVQEVSRHFVWPRLELDITLALVAGDTGRTTLYGGPTVTIPLKHFDVWATYFALHTFEDSDVGGRHVAYDPKPVIGASWSW